MSTTNKNNFYKSAFFFSAMSMVLVVFFVRIATGEFVYITDGNGLVWNCFLALVSFALYCIFRYFWTKKKPFIYVFLFPLWIIFLPNTFYMLTDIKYLSQFDINTFAYPVESATNWRSWLYLFAIVDSVMTGCAYGIIALTDFEETVLTKLNRVLKEIIIGVVMLLVGFGVYIGRFARVNSWDILQPQKLWAEILPYFSINGLVYALIFAYISWMMHFLVKGVHLVLKSKQ